LDFFLINLKIVWDQAKLPKTSLFFVGTVCHLGVEVIKFTSKDRYNH
jgi:hypothetical protein